MIHHRVEFLSHLWTCEIRKYVTCSLNTIVWCKIQVIDIPVKKEKGWKGIKKTHWSQAYLEVQEGNFHWVLRLGNNSVAIGSTIWSQSSDFKSFFPLLSRSWEISLLNTSGRIEKSFNLRTQISETEEVAQGRSVSDSRPFFIGQCRQ